MDWSALLSALGLTFVAELGDKTQLAVVTQVCKRRRPWAVFSGASLALTLVTLIGALGGQLLGQIIPPLPLRITAAGAFVVMGILVRLCWRHCRVGPGRGTGCHRGTGHLQARA